MVPAMGLNQGIPALRNNTPQVLGHNPQDILVSRSGVAIPSPSSNHLQEGLRCIDLEGRLVLCPGQPQGRAVLNSVGQT